MKRRVLAVLSLCAVCALALPASAPRAAALGALQADVVPLTLSDLDAAKALMVVARAFHTDIIIPSGTNKPVSLSLRAHSVDEAVSAIAAAAGLVWRRVGTTIIVATPTDMKAALEARGDQVRVPLTTLPPTEATATLTSALPYLTARPLPDGVLLIGAPEDIRVAREMLRSLEERRVVEPSATEVVTLENAAAAQVTSVLKDVFPAVKVSTVGPTDKPGGILTLTGPQSQVAGAKDLLRRLDIPTSPREPERVYKVYHIKYASAPTLIEFLQKALPDLNVVAGPATYSPLRPSFQPITAVSLGSSGGGISGGGGGGISSGGSSGASSSSGGGGVGGSVGAAIGGAGGSAEGGRADRAKDLVITGTTAQVDAAIAMLDDVDVAPKQVMVEVKVVDTSPEKIEALGIQWNWGTFGFSESGTTTTGGTTTTTGSRPLGFGSFTRTPWSVEAILNALTTDKQSKILADPRMQVTDNDDASIFIGDTFNVQLSQTGALIGTTLQIQTFNVGIILLVRPRVNADGRITMRVHPVVSTITALNLQTGLPQISSREAETTVMVKDGETMVIGGLIRDEEVRTMESIPILSKLPIIGELFKNRSTDHRHSEVVVFITPHIVQP